MTDVSVLRLLADDVERLKHLDTANQAKVEMQDRDAARTSVMLRMANDQLQQWKVDAESTKAAASRLRGENEALKRDAQKWELQAAKLEEKAEAQAILRTSAECDGQKQLAIAEDEVIQARGAVSKLRSALEDARSSALAEKDDLVQELRKAHQVRTALEIQLKSRTEELDNVTQQRSKDGKTAVEAEYRLNRDLVAANKRADTLEEELHSLKRSNFEDLTTLKAQMKQHENHATLMERRCDSEGQDWRVRCSQLESEVRMLTDRAEQELATHRAREKTLEMETAKLVADLCVAQKEINSLADRHATGSKSHLENVVQLQGQRDVLTRRLAALEAELEMQRGAAKAQTLTLRTDAETAQAALTATRQQLDQTKAEHRAEVIKLRADLLVAQEHAKDVEMRKATTTSALEALCDEKDSRVRELDSELNKARKQIESLRDTIRENTEVKLLTDEVGVVKEQNDRLRHQITHTNSVLATLRVEADISESARVQLVQDEAAALQGRLVTMERERRFARPLIRDLIEAAQRESTTLDPGLERDVDIFYQQFGTEE